MSCRMFGKCEVEGVMTVNKWRIIEIFVMNDARFDSDDFEEFLEVINR